MNEGFRWCPHCGKPHGLRESFCAATGKPLDHHLHQRAAAPRVHSARASLIGVVLDGKYRILRAIGSGGMGTVFEAENLTLNRLVALKVVSRPDSADALARFASEAKIVSSLQHPNICDVYDVGVLPDGGPYIALERLVGDTLAGRLSRGRRSTEALIDIFAQVLSGLHAAHTARILHRDLKPQNVFLVDRAGCAPLVKIVDFGLARDLSVPVSRRLTKPGKLAGTLQYMSPEQLRGEALDQTSDVFSVGVLLYEALTGHHPFAAPTQLELQMNILKCEPPSMRSRRPSIPETVEQLVARALCRRPSGRPATALDFQRELLEASSARRLHQHGIEDRAPDSTPNSITTPDWCPPSWSPAA